MKQKGMRWFAMAVFALGTTLGARAQSPPSQGQGGPPGPRFFARTMRGPVGPAGDSAGNVFYFAEPLSDVNNHVVKGAPFSAQITNETVQVLLDGNRIDRKSTGSFARDSVGRTRREMSLPDIGPWVAAGQAPHLAFINDPAAGKIYTLDETKKTAMVMQPSAESGRIRRQFEKERPSGKFANETTTESLGQKTINGVVAQGTRVTRTIPAGQIGNEKPIVITTERWYSPDLETTVLLTRSDPRFGTTTYQLTDINRDEPPQSLFMVPPDYTVTQGDREFMMRKPVGPPPPLLPPLPDRQ